MVWLDDVQGFLNDLVGFLQVIAPFLPALMMLGPFSFGIGLVIFVQILMLVLMVLLGIALVLALLIDDFQHYLDENPTEDAPDVHPDELTEAPEYECAMAGASSADDSLLMLSLSTMSDNGFAGSLIPCIGADDGLLEIVGDALLCAWNIVDYLWCMFDCAVSSASTTPQLAALSAFFLLFTVVSCQATAGAMCVVLAIALIGLATYCHYGECRARLTD